MSGSTPVRQDARIIFSVSFGHAVAHFYNLLLPPLFPWLKAAFGLSWSQLGFLMTVYFLVSGVAQTAAGFLVDRYGARLVLYAGLLGLAMAACLLASAPNYSVLLIGAGLAGLGNSVFHPADFTLMNKCVSAGRLGHAYSTHGIAGHLGWAVAPMYLFGIASLLGWRNAFLAAAVLPLIAVMLLLTARAYWAADTRQLKSELQEGERWQFLRLPAVWACFSFFFISAIALGGIQSFSAASLQHLYQMSVVWATTAFTFYMLGSASGMILGGFLASRSKQHERIIALAFCVAATAAWCIASARIAPTFAVVLMAVTGFGAGIAGPSRDFLIRQAAPKQAMGRVYGIVYGGLELGFACAPLLFAYLMDHKQPDLVFVWIGICQILAIVTALGVKTTLVKNVVTEKLATAPSTGR